MPATETNTTTFRMINQSSNPVLWTLLVQELDDLRGHIESLARQMATDGQIDNEDFEIQVGHAYAHLNRVWNRRNCPQSEISDDEWDAASAFPSDLEPIG